jgi:hypothetical protein
MSGKSTLEIEAGGGRKEITPSAATPCSGVFEECREACPHHVRTPNGGGGIQHDCNHPENSPHLKTEETPCDPRVCPIFTSDDEDGDYEHCRYEHEIEGKWYLPNAPHEPCGAKNDNRESANQ